MIDLEAGRGDIQKNLDAVCVWAAGAIALFFLGHEIWRAGRLSFTFDEAATFLNYVSNDLLEIFDFNVANNHFLNTILAKAFSFVAGTSEIVLRLPSLLGYLLYLHFSFRLLRRFLPPSRALAGFVLLNANPYLLDFFALSRGYGLSLGLLMAGVYHFSRFLEAGPGDAGSPRRVSAALGFLGASAMANFAAINVYLGILVLAAAGFVAANRKKKASRSAGSEKPARPRRWAYRLAGLIFAAAVFNFAAISRDARLSGKMFEPLTVRIDGLGPAEAAGISVECLDQNHQPRELPFENGAWATAGVVFATGLRFRIPGPAAARFEDVRIEIGPKTFRLEGDRLRAGREADRSSELALECDPRVSLPRSASSRFRSAINWKGDRNHILLLVQRFLLFSALLALAAGIAAAVGRFLVRKRFLAWDELRSLVVPTLILSSFAAYPIFMLKRNGELYWGGRSGIIRDTWSSLVDASFYGRLYEGWQNLLIGALCILAVAALLGPILSSLKGRPAPRPALGPGLGALILFVAVSEAAQYAIFGTPYLSGRTGLFLIPLAVLTLLTALENSGRLNRFFRRASGALLAVLTLAAAGHFAATMRTLITVEWRSDANVRDLAGDLTRLKAEFFAREKTVRLGIDWTFIPSIEYYKRRGGLTWLDARWTAERSDNDLYYLAEKFDPARMVLVKEYPASGTILVRARLHPGP